MMEKFNRSILDVVGNTPIIKLHKVATHVTSNLYVKLEFMNPGGSIKVEVFQGDRLIAKRLRSAIPNTKPAGFDSIPIKPE